jgi:hypothetical protein
MGAVMTRDGWDGKMKLSATARDEIEWDVNNIRQFNGRTRQQGGEGTRNSVRHRHHEAIQCRITGVKEIDDYPGSSNNAQVQAGFQELTQQATPTMFLF